MSLVLMLPPLSLPEEQATSNRPARITEKRWIRCDEFANRLRADMILLPYSSAQAVTHHCDAKRNGRIPLSIRVPYPVKRNAARISQSIKETLINHRIYLSADWESSGRFLCEQEPQPGQDDWKVSGQSTTCMHSACKHAIRWNRKSMPCREAAGMSDLMWLISTMNDGAHRPQQRCGRMPFMFARAWNIRRSGYQCRNPARHAFFLASSYCPLHPGAREGSR